MSSFLKEQEKKEIASAITEAEKKTIGEIRVYIEKHCKGEVMDHALKIFHRLKMHHTRGRTGVLIYVAHDDHVFAIIGDEGIHKKVPENFWDDVKEKMTSHFGQGNFAAGLKYAINTCGEHLKKHFPADGENPNELSNEVVVSEK